MSRKTHYEILGVPSSATILQIKAAYRKLAKLHHPDHSTEPQAAARFIEINASYEVLSDPQRRSVYDQTLLQMQRIAERKVRPPQPVQKKKVAERASPSVLRLTTMFHLGRFLDAERLAQDLTRTEPNQPIPYAVLGDLAKVRGDLPRAAKMYALAAQMDPGNSTYLRKHEDLVKVLARESTTHSKTGEAPFRVLVGIGICVLCFLYLALAREAPLFATLDVISTWTTGVIMSLFLSGVAIGASLTSAGLMARFGAMQGHAVLKLSPMVALGVVAVVNFWVALLLYFMVGAWQNAFNASSSRAMGSVAAITAFLTLGSTIQGRIDPLQVIFWGGNLVYAGLLAGWMVADGLRID